MRGKIAALSAAVRVRARKPYIVETSARPLPEIRRRGAGAGGSLAGSLRADLEYRPRCLSPHWAVGAWLDIDRSAYYAPTQAMLYLRYAVAPHSPARCATRHRH